MSPLESSAPTTPNTFRLLLWLKWTLLWRAYYRQKVRIVGVALTILLFAPLSIGVAVFCYLYAHDDPLIVPNLARAILGTIYLVWLTTPLLGFSLNESYDPSRLFVYPVPLRTIFAASVVGSFFEISTLLALPILFAVWLLLSTSPVASITAAIALILFMLHTLALAQLVMLLLVGFLRSRRFRDITIVLFPLFTMIFYVLQQSALSPYAQHNFINVLNWPIWNAIGVIPPGWALNAASCASQGDNIGALWNLGTLVVGTVLPILAASSVTKGLYLGDRGPLALVRTSSQPVHRPIDESPFTNQSLFGAQNSDIMSMVRKEFIYFRRDPMYKAMAVNAAYTVVVIFFAFIVRSRDFAGPTNIWMQSSTGIGLFASLLDVIRSFALPTVLLLGSLLLLFNIFGAEGSAITVLLSFPVSRIRLIVAKNLAHAPVVIALGMIGVLGQSLFGLIKFVPLETSWIILAAPVIIGAGNLVSVRFPHRMVIRGQQFGRRGQMSMGGGVSGCGFAFLYMGCYAGALALLIPVAIAIGAPVVAERSELLAITIPVALVYSVAIYWGATILAGRLLAQREPELVKALTPDE